MLTPREIDNRTKVREAHLQTRRSTLVFFLTWFPTYLITERQMDWLESGIFAVMPYIAASVGVLVGGVISDKLIERTGSANVGRKLPIVSGLLLAATIVLANYVESDTLVIVVMSVAFFGQGMVNLGWTLISAYEIFTGIPADADRMARTFVECAADNYSASGSQL